MNLDEIRIICLKQKGAWEDLPFGDDPLVIKVGTKMFALLSLESNRISLKCEPLLAIEYRNKYKNIKPGYHLNKKHWNTIELDMNLANGFINEMIEMSYRLVFRSLNRKLQEEITQ